VFLVVHLVYGYGSSLFRVIDVRCAIPFHYVMLRLTFLFPSGLSSIPSIVYILVYIPIHLSFLALPFPIFLISSWFHLFSVLVFHIVYHFPLKFWRTLTFNCVQHVFLSDTPTFILYPPLGLCLTFLWTLSCLSIELSWSYIWCQCDAGQWVSTR
jgi:hypothetical protein